MAITGNKHEWSYDGIIHLENATEDDVKYIASVMKEVGDSAYEQAVEHERARISLFNEKELNRYNKEKLQKMKKELEVLRQNADSFEIKKPIIYNGYYVCPCEVDCNR